MFKRSIFAAVACVLTLSPTVSEAATVVKEVFQFKATLTQGNVRCGVFVGREDSCPEKFGTFSTSRGDRLVNGMSIGETYSGQVVLRSSEGRLEGAHCQLNGGDCLFSTDLLELPLPAGPTGTVDFTETSVVASFFDFAAGTYSFSTDYTHDPDGMHYYSSLSFDLTDVSYSVTEVPLPAAAGLLLAALLGLGGIRYLGRRET